MIDYRNKKIHERHCKFNVTYSLKHQTHCYIILSSQSISHNQYNNIHDTIGIEYFVNNIINNMRVPMYIDGRAVVPAIDLPLLLAARGLSSLYDNIIRRKS